MPFLPVGTQGKKKGRHSHERTEETTKKESSGSWREPLNSLPSKKTKYTNRAARTWLENWKEEEKNEATTSGRAVVSTFQEEERGRNRTASEPVIFRRVRSETSMDEITSLEDSYGVRRKEEAAADKAYFAYKAARGVVPWRGSP